MDKWIYLDYARNSSSKKMDAYVIDNDVWGW